MNELDALLTAADAADRVLRKYYRTGVAVARKADGSPVTRADQESEKAVLDVLTDAFPDYGYLSEETGQHGDQKNRWVIDPLDGTNTFIRGLPFFGPLLAFEREGKPVAGVISLPMLEERCWATDGKAFWNGKACSVSGTSDIKRAFVTAEIMRTAREGYGPALLALVDGAQHERGYSDCYGYFLVATGQADVFIEGYPHEWDVAAPTACIEAAGGQVSRLEGNYNGLSLATNGALHDSVLAFLHARHKS